MIKTSYNDIQYDYYSEIRIKNGKLIWKQMNELRINRL